MHTKPLLMAGLLATAVAAAGAVHAESNSGSNDKAEMQAVLAARISLSDAARAAEAGTGGKAMEAVFTDENGKPGYEVTTAMADGTEMNLFVDAATGKAEKATAQAENEQDGNAAMDDSQEGESD